MSPSPTKKVNLTPEQVQALGVQLISIAAIFNPAGAATIGGLMTVGLELNRMLQRIKDGVTPEVWAEVVEKNRAAVEKFEKSVAAHPGR